MAVERRLQQGPMAQEEAGAAAAVKQTTNTINVFAVEQTLTQEDHVTKQGFGYTSPLKEPRKSIYFSWNGKLHGSEKNVVSTSGGGQTVQAAAEHFSPVYRSHLNPDAIKAGVSSYRFDFTPPKNTDQKGARALDAAEKGLFLEAFRAANEEATGQKTNLISVYAVEQTRTHQDRVTEQGFGISTPLKEPQTTVAYLWKGRLHGSAPDVISTSGVGANPETCAKNFSPNYLSHQNLEGERKGIPSYRLDFKPPKGDAQEGARALSPDERDRFNRAFILALEAAPKAK
jgi:hypothetical protein